MRVLTALLLLAVASDAADVKSPKKKEEGKTEKRALEEGNAGVEKRTVLLSTAAPGVSPGVEYADSTETLADKSPAQQVYATPVPQIAKISDVLTAQGPPFQAIASHLYSPISVYQARLGSPTTYEVSAPVPSQLAYSEHKVFPQNIPFSPQFYKHKVQTKPFPGLAATYTNLPQQIFVQQRVSQPIYQHFPDVYQPHIYSNPPQFYQQNQPYQDFVHPSAQQSPIIHPRITYAQEKVPLEANPQIQEELNTSLPTKVTEAPQPPPSQAPQNYNQQSQGAVSYASFSQSQPHQREYIQNTSPTAATPYAHFIQKEQIKQFSQPAYFRQGPAVPFQFGPQLYPAPGYNLGYNGPLVAPTFPPVQYFGKFAQAIFSGYHH